MALIRDGATVLISFGIAGALDPALRAGDLIIPSDCLLSDGSHAALSRDAVARLRTAFPDARGGTIQASDTLVGSVAAKRALFLKGGAQAVDMETAAMIDAARAAGIPCAVFRAIADEAGDGLPPAAIVGLNDKGGIDALAVALSILRQPAQVPSLMRTGRLSRIAFATLNASTLGLKTTLT